MPRDPRHLAAPVSSGALVQYARRPAEELDDDFDDASSYTASISPGSSVSNRSSQPGGLRPNNQPQDPLYYGWDPGHNPPPAYSRREHAGVARRSSPPMPRVSHMRRPLSAHSSATSQTTSRSATTSRSSGSQSSRVQEVAPRQEINSTDHESWILAIYLTHLLDQQSRPLHKVQAFIRDSDRFAKVRPKLSLMGLDAFGFWRENVQQNNAGLCDKIKRDRAPAVVDSFMKDIEEEWNDWTFEERRGRSTQPRGLSVHYENSWTTGSVTYIESFRITRH